MRRVVGYVLLGLGAFMLVLAPLLRFYAAPRLAKAPLDQYSITVSRAPNATFLDIGKLEIRKGETLTATRTVRGDVPSSSDDVSVYDVFLKIEDPNNVLVTATTDRVAFDRHTTEAVHCCNENLNGKPTRHEGIEYKFPFGAEKKTYQYFDTSLAKATDMVYKGTVTLEGITVYRYEQRIEPTQIAELDVPGSLIGSPAPAVKAGRFYSNTRTVWVEPTTGVIVKGQEKQFSTLRDDTGTDKLTITEATLTFTPKTVREQGDKAKDGKRSLDLIKTTVPFILLVLGLVLVLLGLGLALSGGPAPERGEHEAEAGPRAPART